MMGCSNPHPHGQIWANSFLPNEAANEDQHQRSYLAANGRPLLLDYAQAESDGSRVVVDTAHWLALVPYWAAWPFETLLLPKAHVRRLPDLDAEQRPRPGAGAQTINQPLRQPLPVFLPLLDGLAWRALQR